MARKVNMDEGIALGGILEICELRSRGRYGKLPEVFLEERSKCHRAKDC